ncbi:MAG TPA: hypothetical protein VL442_02945 [Mucilaginibacter sp.]|jgi:hypothetical protein|nr:hypothetical protein [Mucilaginibacter sp.]
MTTEEILKIIYQYYPKGLSMDNSNYDKSTEYLNRLKICERARQNNEEWSNFKTELNSFCLQEFNQKVFDYSVLGSEPCYCLSVGLDLPNGRVIISILISVIIPLWLYRIIDNDEIRFKEYYDEERKLLDFSANLINKYFSGYQSIKEDQHQAIVYDIDTVFMSSPTILEAIFKMDLN